MSGWQTRADFKEKKKFESIYSNFGKLDRSDTDNISLHYETV